LRNIVTFISLFFCSFCFAQLTNQDNFIQQYRFGNLSQENGLSQGTVYAIAQDEKGFLWFGTQDGLNRWDGNSIKVWQHRPLDDNSISQGYIRALYIDKNNVWIGYEGGGINILNTENEKIIKYEHENKDPTSLCSNIIYDIIKDHNGNILIATEKGINKYNYRTKNFKLLKHYSKELFSQKSIIVNCIFEDKQNYLWVGTKKGLYKLDSNYDVVKEYFNSSIDISKTNQANIKAIYQDSKGKIWIAAYGEGLLYYDSIQDCFKKTIGKNSLISDFVYKITEGNNNELFLATINGLNVLNTKNNECYVYTHDKNNLYSLRNNQIITLFKDKRNALWISTSGKGLGILDLQQYPFYFTNNLKNENISFIYGIYEDRKANLWISTSGNGLLKWNRKINSFKKYLHNSKDINSISYNTLRVTIEDFQDNIWIGTDKKGLDKINTSTDKITNYKKSIDNLGITGNIITCLLEDLDSTLWVGTYNSGLFSYSHSTKKFKRYPLGNIIIRCLLEDDKGRIWIGTNNNGIFIYNKKNKSFKKLSIKLPIRCIYQDKNKTIWVGTNGDGIYKIKESKERFITSYINKQNGLLNNVIYGILEDNHNNLWVSSNSGISKFNKKTQEVTNYDKYNGIIETEFNGGAFVKDKNGWFYFGGVDGITYFHPDSILSKNFKPQASISSFKLFNQEVFQNYQIKSSTLQLKKNIPYIQKNINDLENLVLNYNQNFLSFELSSLGKFPNEYAEFSYILEGADKAWNNIGNRNFISLSNLSHGEYMLKIKAKLNYGEWGEEKIIKINILPPFWQTWWFYFICIIIGTGSIIGYIKWRTHKLKTENLLLENTVNKRTQEIQLQKTEIEIKNTELEKLHQLNQKIFSVIAHDFNEPLLSMRFLLETIKKQENKKSEISYYTSDVRNQLIQSEMILQNLLNWAKHELNLNEYQIQSYSTVTKVLDEIISQTKPQWSAKKILINNLIDNHIKAKISEDLLKIIYRNLITNAIKYSPQNSSINCGLDLKTNYFYVKDFGIGIEQSTLQKLFKGAVKPSFGTVYEKGFGLGLYITFEIIKKSNGTIEIESEINNGSTVKFLLPSD
jgi:ligand-binding sensor domain-containing protein/signal transduction histidine kinase